MRDADLPKPYPELGYGRMGVGVVGAHAAVGQGQEASRVPSSQGLQAQGPGGGEPQGLQGEVGDGLPWPWRGFLPHLLYEPPPPEPVQHGRVGARGGGTLLHLHHRGPASQEAQAVIQGGAQHLAPGDALEGAGNPPQEEHVLLPHGGAGLQAGQGGAVGPEEEDGLIGVPCCLGQGLRR